MNKVVVACFGDQASADRITELSATSEVIAVAFDFGGAVSLAATCDVALAAGATRCHALDVREEFARDVLLPAIRFRTYADPTAAFAALAPAFAARKVEEIAALEHASALLPRDVAVASRSLPPSFTAPVHLDIAFEDGLPVAVNGVPMMLTELMESIETITGEPALYVLDREMTRSREHQIA
jgi:argininosuccinate synthase